MQRKDLEEHVTINCTWRILVCDHCSEEHPECNMKDHFEQCSKFPVTCPNGCSALICREMIPNHTGDDCPLTIVPCPYEKMGCKTKVQRREMEFHLQISMALHLDLACVKLNNTEVKLNDTQVKLYESGLKLNEQLNDMQETTRKLMEKIDKLEQKLSEGKRNEAEPKKMVVQHEPSGFSRVFVWKIINFSRVLIEAKSEGIKKIESAPFNTESYGHMLKLRIYPNGSGSGKNTHLSLFIVVLRGEYDAILSWPFKKKVKITLIDQQKNSVERENVIKEIKPDNSRAYERPIPHKENLGMGTVGFISHEQLFTRRYLEDDTLFLEVEVE